MNKCSWKCFSSLLLLLLTTTTLPWLLRTICLYWFFCIALMSCSLQNEKKKVKLISWAANTLTVCTALKYSLNLKRISLYKNHWHWAVFFNSSTTNPSRWIKHLPDSVCEIIRITTYLTAQFLETSSLLLLRIQILWTEFWIRNTSNRGSTIKQKSHT